MDFAAAADRLREPQRELPARAARRASTGEAEILFGLGEIVAHGFYLSADAPAANRRVRMLDESESGFGLEGESVDCGHVAVGDLVGIRLREGEAPVLCCIARRIPCGEGKVRFGAYRLSSPNQPARVVALDRPGAPSAPLMFVPGADASGRHDGFLVSDITFEKGERIEIAAESLRLTLRLSGVRKRGSGWVLAGYEVVDVGVRP